MFVGQYSHNIDAKGRLAVPAKFRSELKKAVVTRGLDNCLFLYPKKEWEVLAQKIAASPIGRASARSFSRFMLAGAMEVEFDSQGRIILPEYLRNFAGIKKATVIIGVYSRLEIWDETKWQTYQSEAEKNSNDIAEALNDLQISI